MTSFTYLHGPSDRRVVHSTAAMATFILTWLLSLMCPIIVLFLLRLGWIQTAVAVASFALFCYSPVLPQSSSLRTWLGTGAEHYYMNSSLKYEEPFFEERGSSGTTKKVLSVHPHGITCQGWGILFTRPELQRLVFCFSSVLYYSPFFHALARVCGKPSPADRTTFQSLMKRGEPIALIPGGFQEATIHTSTAHRVKCGKGFVKYALQYGYSLVPCYSFGENKTYNNFQGFWRPRLWLNKFGIPGIAPFGSWFMPILPKYHGGLHIVVGKALRLPMLANPTNDQVEKYHMKYMERLKELFDRHKATYGEPHAELAVW